MNPVDFDYIIGLVKERSGLVLTKDKAYLLESRLMPVARKHGLANLDELIGEIRANKDESVIIQVTEAMTTNESFFFRDIKPFDLFRNEVLPSLIKTRATKRSFRIWCAAASSGQEPYTLAMILKEEADKLSGWRYEIVATDISTEILEKAKAGIYSQFEVQRGLPIEYLVKYFKKVDDLWQIDKSLRAMVKFKEFNLLGNLSTLGIFDIVFCRNVLIYFDHATKSNVLHQISALMPNDGLLILGGAETVVGISDAFKPIQGQRGVYGLTRVAGKSIAPKALAASSSAVRPV